MKNKKNILLRIIDILSKKDKDRVTLTDTGEFQRPLTDEEAKYYKSKGYPII